MSSYELNLEDNFLYLTGIEDYKITLVAGKPYIVTPAYSGLLEDNSELLRKENPLVLFIFLNELTTYIAESQLKADQEAPEQPCSFWNTHYSVGIGLNESAAMADFLYHNKKDLSGPLAGCTAIGDAEVANVGIGYYVTKAYCC